MIQNASQQAPAASPPQKDAPAPVKSGERSVMHSAVLTLLREWAQSAGELYGFSSNKLANLAAGANLPSFGSLVAAALRLPSTHIDLKHPWNDPLLVKARDCWLAECSKLGRPAAVSLFIAAAELYALRTRREPVPHHAALKELGISVGSVPKLARFEFTPLKHVIPAFKRLDAKLGSYFSAPAFAKLWQKGLAEQETSNVQRHVGERLLGQGLGALELTQILGVEGRTARTRLSRVISGEQRAPGSALGRLELIACRSRGELQQRFGAVIADAEQRRSRKGRYNPPESGVIRDVFGIEPADFPKKQQAMVIECEGDIRTGAEDMSTVVALVAERAAVVARKTLIGCLRFYHEREPLAALNVPEAIRRAEERRLLDDETCGRVLLPKYIAGTETPVLAKLRAMLEIDSLPPALEIDCRLRRAAQDANKQNSFQRCLDMLMTQSHESRSAFRRAFDTAAAPWDKHRFENTIFRLKLNCLHERSHVSRILEHAELEPHMRRIVTALVTSFVERLKADEPADYRATLVLMLAKLPAKARQMFLCDLKALQDHCTAQAQPIDVAHLSLDELLSEKFTQQAATLAILRTNPQPFAATSALRALRALPGITREELGDVWKMLKSDLAAAGETTEAPAVTTQNAGPAFMPQSDVRSIIALLDEGRQAAAAAAAEPGPAAAPANAPAHKGLHFGSVSLEDPSVYRAFQREATSVAQAICAISDGRELRQHEYESLQGLVVRNHGVRVLLLQAAAHERNATSNAVRQLALNTSVLPFGDTPEEQSLRGELEEWAAQYPGHAFAEALRKSGFLAGR